MQVLPLEILQNQACSACFNYLSVMPITQIKSGEMLCGRPACTQTSNGAKSLLNTIMESFKFRCVNYLDGCKEYLTSLTSEQHDKLCKYKPHECFFCSFKGNWAQIVFHLKADHSSKVTEDLSFLFEIYEESSQQFIYLAEDDVYLIYVNVTSKELEVVITRANNVGANIRANIKQSTIKFYHEKQNIFTDYSFFDNSRSKNYFRKKMDELECFFDPGTMVTCKIYLEPVNLSEKEIELEKTVEWINARTNFLRKQQKSIKDFKYKLTKERNNMEALSKVFKQIIPDIFRCECNVNESKKTVKDVLFLCENRHSYCEECVPEICNYCKDTDENCLDFKKIEGLSKIFLSCDWDGCNKFIDISSYLDHNRSCSQRIFKCPVLNCTSILKSSQALIDHWHSSIELKCLPNFVDVTKRGVSKYYWLLNENLYLIDVNFQKFKVAVIIEPSNVVPNGDRTTFVVEGGCGSQYYSNWVSATEIRSNGKYVFFAEGQGECTTPLGVVRIRVSPLTLAKESTCDCSSSPDPLFF